MQSVFPKGLLVFMPSQLFLDYFPSPLLPIFDSTVRRFNIPSFALPVLIGVNPRRHFKHSSLPAVVFSVFFRENPW